MVHTVNNSGPDSHKNRHNCSCPVHDRGCRHGENHLPESVVSNARLGIAWWNSLSEREREKWMRLAGDTGVAADAWAAFQASQHHTNRE
jgi:hypothetical protein